MHEPATQVLLIVRGQFGIAGDMHDSITHYHAVRSNHLGNRQGGSNLHHGDAGLLQLRCDRSAAASARPSRRSQNDGVDAIPLRFLRHLTAQAPRIGKRIDAARSRNKFIVQLADDTTLFHFAHGI